MISLSPQSRSLLIVRCDDTSASADSGKFPGFPSKFNEGNVLRLQLFEYSPREETWGYLEDKFRDGKLNIN